MVFLYYRLTSLSACPEELLYEMVDEMEKWELIRLKAAVETLLALTVTPQGDMASLLVLQLLSSNCNPSSGCGEPSSPTAC